MRIDRVALDLPYYDGLLVGHHHKEPGHRSRRARGTDDWLLVATLSGGGRFLTSAGESAALPGSIALLAPGTPHDYGTARDAEGWEILWVHFHPPADWFEFLNWSRSAPGLAMVSPAGWTEVVGAFLDVLRLALAPGRRRRELAMNALERLLLLCESEMPSPESGLDSRIRAATEYIQGHLQEPLSLDTLSASACLSPSRFSHLFREHVGMAPLQYANLQRMERAQSLLKRTTLSIAEIATEVGMEPFHFSARFKVHTGMSPRTYRGNEA